MNVYLAKLVVLGGILTSLHSYRIAHREVVKDQYVSISGDGNFLLVCKERAGG